MLNSPMEQQRTGPKTSAKLLLQVRDSEDSESWRTFERIYGSIVRSYCRHWHLQPVDTDDIIQEVMSVVVTGIRNFDYDPNRGRFRAWLGTVVANKIKRLLGRNAKRRETGLPFENESEDYGKVYTDPDSNWVRVYSGQILGEACRVSRADFEENTWRCFEATWLENLSPSEVASELGIAIHAVYVNKSRVLKRLEQEIRNLAEDLAYDFPDSL